MPVAAGTMLLLRFAAANRDPEKFENPDAFDVERKNARAHVAFGRGIHMCVGNMLSRKELAVAFARLLERLEEDPEERVDSRDYLAARLVDLIVGDWDRHADQWRWAGYERGDRWTWRPIPRDRDNAYSDYEGISSATARASAMIFAASASPRPRAPYPPSTFTACGVSPTCPITGIPRPTRNAIVGAIAAPPSSFTAAHPVSFITRAADANAASGPAS